ncbi:SusC/RagA family TonB-linked outer membrane protein [Chitinophaga sp. MM2321]|uniref:SusC/RagA family TonB-linked outer membrane protein n=1 Tax=Chitinophaga sp. MM2321 TaxID=3137178 RepID=UPI0032D58683
MAKHILPLHLPAILLTFVCLPFLSMATTVRDAQFAHEDQKVSIDVKNAPMEDVFKLICKQTGLSFIGKDAGFTNKERISLQVKNVELKKVLNEILPVGKYIWIFTDDVLVVRKIGIDAEKKNIFETWWAWKEQPIVTGKVMDAAGTPVPGATVMVKGTDKGTITNERGEFELKNIDDNAILLISSMGYENEVIKVDGKDRIFVRVLLKINMLDETQVIAYGTTSRRLSTGNINTVKGTEIAMQPVGNVLLALQGRVPGLFVTQTNGIPGGGVTVRVQGQNSLKNGNDPFYVIDGVPYNSQLLPMIRGILGSSGGNMVINGVNNSGPVGNPLSYINPADIESIEVLKDADATAIYGSRAANGAILITTKKGRQGPTNVDVNLQNGWGQVTRRSNLLNTPQYLLMRHEAISNDGLATSATDYDINGTWDTTRYTDWQKELIGGTAHYTDGHITISGGNATTQFLVGAGYKRETMVFPGDFDDQKGSLQFNVSSISVNQKFRISLSGNYLVDNNKLPGDDFTASARTLAPTAPSLYNADGTLNWETLPTGAATWDNPLVSLYRKYSLKTNNLVSNIQTRYQLLPGLDIGSSFGYTNIQSIETAINPLIAVRPEDRPYASRTAIYGNNNVLSWTIEPQVTYKRSIAKGKLDALMGATISQNNNNGQQFIGFNYNSDQALKDIHSASTVLSSSNVVFVYKYNAVFGRLNYTWNEKYILNMTGRRDGSSRFGSENQFHDFWSTGFGWVFSSEDFMKKMLPFISFGKLSGSYGTTGNDQIGEYQFLNLYNPIDVGVPYQGIASLRPNGLANPYLQWEETKKMQVGLSLGMAKDKILLNTYYYQNRSSNQLLSYGLPIIVGFGAVQKNIPATVENSGWEFAANTTNLKSSNFRWSSNINLTIPKNKLLAFKDLATSSYASSYTIGLPITAIKVYHLQGVDPASGIYQFTTEHGSPTTNPNYLTDRPVLINTAPTWYGGFQNSFSYKDFQLDFLFQFVKQTRIGSFLGSLPGTRNNNQPTWVLERWQHPNDIASHQQYSATYNGAIFPAVFASMTSDASYSNASYIRLKNLSFSWQLPGQWKNKLHLKKGSIYLQGQNLLTLTKYKGLDPETGLGLPPLRVWNFGLQVGL